MRNSAITRIVIYSVLILLLLGLLGSALSFHHHGGWRNFIGRIDKDLEFDFDFDDDDDDFFEEDERNLLSPNPGEPVNIEAEKISKILVDWISGDVIVEPGSVETIQLQETGGGDPMVYAVKGSRLEVKFSKKLKNISWNVGSSMPSKDLIVTVPRDWAGKELEVHSVSADVEIRDLELEEVEYQGVSGECLVENSKVGELSVQTVSGNVTVNGEIWELECESVSADCDLTVTNVPREISMEGVSGNLKLTLPENAGFTVELDGLNKDLDTDFEVTYANGRYVSGDGSCEIEIEGISGKAKIRKAA